MNRRDFLKNAGITGRGVILASTPYIHGRFRRRKTGLLRKIHRIRYRPMFQDVQQTQGNRIDFFRRPTTPFRSAHQLQVGTWAMRRLPDTVN